MPFDFHIRIPLCCFLSGSLSNPFVLQLWCTTEAVVAFDGSLSNPSRNSFGRISDTDANPAAQSEVFSADQGIELLKNEKRIQQLEKRKEILYYSGHQQTDNVR